MNRDVRSGEGDDVVIGGEARVGDDPCLDVDGHYREYTVQASGPGEPNAIIARAHVTDGESDRPVQDCCAAEAIDACVRHAPPLHVPVAGLSIAPACDPIEQPDGPDDDENPGKEEEHVGHGLSSATTSAKTSAPAHMAIAAMTTGHGASGSPNANPMTAAPATIFAISGTLSASTARRRGVNRSIVSTPEIVAERVPTLLPSIAPRLRGAAVRLCHALAGARRQFLTR